ncbi:MAG: cobalamin-binding protein [Nitrospirota bacterium]
MRICSLLPGATEVVAALDLADDLVGISHECDFPPAIRNKPVLVRAVVEGDRATSADIHRQVAASLGSNRRLYELDEPAFRRAKPELVITQNLCHVCAVTPDQLQQAIAALPAPPSLLTLNPTRLDDVLADIERIGSATGKLSEAKAWTAALRKRLDDLRAPVADRRNRPRVACLEWLDPLYTAGHWVPEMVEWAGGTEVLASAGGPSRPITWDQVRSAEPDVLVLMPCGFPIDRTLRELERLAPEASWPGWESLPAVRHDRVFVVDGPSYFNRPGPRLVEGVAILATAIHPEVFGSDLPSGIQRMSRLPRTRSQSDA